MLPPISISTTDVTPHDLTFVRECPDCGLFSVLTSHPVAGHSMACPRCDKVLRHSHHHPITAIMVRTITGLLFFSVIMTAPLMHVIFLNRFRSDTILSGIGVLSDQGLWPLALVVFMAIVVLPLVRLGSLFLVIGSLFFSHPPQWIVPLFRMTKPLNPWSMAEIYLLGFIVAYTRLQALTHVSLGIAVFALIGLTLSLVMIDATLDHESVWRLMQRRGLVPRFHVAPYGKLRGCDICHQANPVEVKACLRCGAALHHRKPLSFQRTWALTLAATVFYIPANIFPMMYMTKLGKTQAYTIMGGVHEFIRVGLWPLAALVFAASVLIPIMKLLALTVMLIRTHEGSRVFLKERTCIYRFLDFIGRWSMIDVFMLSILVGLMRFGQLGQVTSGIGALYFAAVVILTMYAVLSFDPRLMWDAAGEGVDRYQALQHEAGKTV